MTNVDGGTPLSLPLGITTVDVFGRLLNPNGTASVGTVDFAPSTVVAYTGSDVSLMQVPITIELDPTGYFFLTLPATDDPAGSVLDWTYTVTEHMPGGRTRSLSLPSIPAVTDYADLVAVPSSSGTAVNPQITYATISLLDGGSP